MTAGLAEIDVCAKRSAKEGGPERGVFDQEEFLARALAKAGTKAEIGRILGVPSSRVAEMYRPNTTFRLTMKQGMQLAEALDMSPGQAVNVDTLTPVLRVCLRHAPKEWTEQAVARLAQEIVFGLELQQSLQGDADIPADPTDGPGRDKLA